MSAGALLDMPPKPRKDRPPADAPRKALVSLKGTPTLAAWLDELVEHSESGTRANALVRAMRAFAVAQGFPDPMPKR
jgi:hypothetical protein